MSASHADSSLVRVLRLDLTLAVMVGLLMALGLVVLYSAGGGEQALLTRQGIRLALGVGILLVVAQAPSEVLKAWSPWIYGAAVGLLIWVMLGGDVGKGAQRWLQVGPVRFQPSEILKLVVPMTLAGFFAGRALPPTFLQVLVAGALVALPAVLVALQPDLGTALLVASAGLFVIFLAGIGWRLLFALGGLALASLPVLWHTMHGYQRRRVLTMFDPESDPLGAGYHIIQSKIAIGSGGMYGKGWLNGTQSQLDFIPERATDFIFAVYAEEFGFVGVGLLVAIYALIVLRGLFIAARARDTYARLLAGSLSLSFFVYFFVNIGMVSGVLPVVGVPLPLVSYGGSSMVTLMAAFGMLMSIHSQRRPLAR